MLPQFPGGASTPPISSSINNAAPAPGGLANSNVASMLGMGGVNGSWAPNQNDFIKAMHKAGFSAGDAALLFNFLQSGAGYNPQVAQALIASMQPGVQRKEADILEQFGNMGLRGSSSAQLAMGDFLAQEQLNEGQIFAQMYEQSVQNYMNVLLAGKGPAPKSLWDNISPIIQTMMSNANTVAKAGGA
jgi:hypothetical protein